MRKRIRSILSGGETLESRNLLTGELMAFHLRTTNLAGTPVSQVQVGENFQLQVYVEDLRGQPGVGERRGLRAAHLDVTYNDILAIRTGAITHGADFGAFATDAAITRNDVTTSGILNEVGSTKQRLTDLNHSLGLGQFLLFSVPFRATSAGQLTFGANAADIVPGNPVLLESAAATSLTPAEMVLPTLQLTVLSPAGADAQFNVRLVKTPTTLNAQGELAALPANVAFLDEWDSYYAEVYVTSEGLADLAVTGATINLSYRKEYFTAVEIQAGPAFTVNQAGAIDDALGRVRLDGTARSGFTPGDDAHVLLGRVRFSATAADTGLSIGLTTPSPIQRAAPGWLDLAGDGTASVELAGANESFNIERGASPPTDLWPVMYDLDDDGTVDFGDFSIFTGTFLSPISTSRPETFKTDFNLSGAINFADFSLFGANFLFTRGGATPRIYPPNFPTAFRPALLTINSGVMAVDDNFTFRKDDGFQFLNVTQNDMGMEGAVLEVASINTTGTIGLANLFGTTVTYSPFGRFDHLLAGQTAIDRFDYTVRDRDGNTDVGTVFITIEGIDNLAEMAVTVRRQPTTTSASGQVNQIPANEDWLGEWDTFYAEVWAKTRPATSGGIHIASATLQYESDVYSAVEITPGPGFRFYNGSEEDDENGLSDPEIDDAMGRVSVDAVATNASLGANHGPVLVARVRFNSVANQDSGILFEQFHGGPVEPISEALLEFTSAYLNLEGIGETSLIEFQPAPETTIWPVAYDLNDDRRIGFDDLALFSGAFLQTTGSSAMSYVADFNASGRVGFDDFGLFAANFLQRSESAASLVYPAGYPDILLPGGLGQGGGNANSVPPATPLSPAPLSERDLGAIVDAAKQILGDSLGPEALDALAGVVVLPADLAAGRLGQATGRIVLIDRDAGGFGWFIDATPLANEEYFQESSGQWRAVAGSVAAGRFDLLSTVVHELGHVLGHDHSQDAEHWMNEAIDVGIRRSPAGDLHIAYGDSIQYDSAVERVFGSLGDE